MTVELTALVVYDSRIFYHGSHVSRWANAVERRFVTNARQAAPVRSGELAANIHGESFRSGVRHWDVHIHSDAEHTMYVLRGTTGPIMSNRMWAFRSRTGLRFPRGGRIPPSAATRWNELPRMDFLRQNYYLLRVRAGKGFPETFRISVEGQEANNFFADAADATARRHPSLRGFSPGYGF